MRVAAVTRAGDRGRLIELATTDPGASCCPDCGMRSSSVKGHAVTHPQDIRYGVDPIRLHMTTRPPLTLGTITEAERDELATCVHESGHAIAGVCQRRLNFDPLSSVEF